MVAALTDREQTRRDAAWAVTFRGTAELTYYVEAGSAAEAKAKAKNGDVLDSSDIEFVKGCPYTTKARRNDG